MTLLANKARRGDAARPPRSRNIEEIVATTCLHQLLARSPEIVRTATEPGAVVIVEVPTSNMVDAFAETWRELVLQTDDVPDDGDDRQVEPGRLAPWLEFRRTTDQGPMEHERRRVHKAIAAGQAIYAFCVHAEDQLPRDLVRIAQLRLRIEPMDAETLDAVLTAMTGSTMARPLPVEVAKLVTIDDLYLASRPNQTVDDLAERLLKLVPPPSAAPPALTLDRLRGMDGPVAWGMQLARDLELFRKQQLAWSAVDKGLLLWGPPGTGKTIFARALAATCGVPLVAASYGQWQSKGHQGDMLKAMRASFSEARNAAPAILFIDELDSFGDRQRTDSRQRDYCVQVINALLEELDGTQGRHGVVVVGACNDPSSLDPAIVRAGRLDTTIPIALPDTEALIGILRFHLAGALAEEDLRPYALHVAGATGADCEKWVRGARRRAREAGRDMAGEDLWAAIRGAERKMPPALRHRLAVHEAGHALLAVLFRPGTLQCVTIRSGSPSTLCKIDLDTVGSRGEIETLLCQLLAGRAAEEVILGDVSASSGGGEESDLAKATHLAVAMIGSFGLDDSLVWSGVQDSWQTTQLLAMNSALAGRVHEVLDGIYERAKSIIRSNRLLIRQIAEQLVEHETLDGADIEKLVRTHGPPPAATG